MTLAAYAGSFEELNDTLKCIDDITVFTVICSMKFLYLVI